MGVCCANRQGPTVIITGKKEKFDTESKQNAMSNKKINKSSSFKNSERINSNEKIDIAKKIKSDEEVQMEEAMKSNNNQQDCIKADSSSPLKVPAQRSNHEGKENELNLVENNTKNSSNIKNTFKTGTIKHDKKDFDVKAKIVKVDATVQDNYFVMSKLGKGSFGTVYKVYHKSTRQTRAMKVIKKEVVLMQDDEQKFLKEIEILKELDHMNVIKIYEYYEDEINYYLIGEFVSGGELYDTIVQWTFFDENVAKNIFKQIISAIAYLHNKNIIHRDIKPENILVENMKGQEINIKLIDFGTSNYIKKDKKLQLQVGSPYYIAPEVLEGEYNEKCDIWSCGCLLYVLLVGYPPFEANSTDKLLEKVKKGKFDIQDESWDYVTEEAKDLVKKMLQKKPDNRISANEILSHPWIKSEVKVKQKEMKSVLNKIKNFNVQDKLQQATLNYIVHFLTPPSEFEELKKAFKSLDQNSDGTLSKSELKQGFEKLFGSIGKAYEVDKILDDMDSDNSGTISYEEFLVAVLNRAKLFNETNLRLCFESFDSNKDNKLSAEEIRKALGAKDNKYVNQLISLIDENGNNEIDFDEFKDLMNVLLKTEKHDKK